GDCIGEETAKRAECLDQQWFCSREEARNCREEWRKDDNTTRPIPRWATRRRQRMSPPGMNIRQAEKSANRTTEPITVGTSMAAHYHLISGQNLGAGAPRMSHHSRVRTQTTLFGTTEACCVRRAAYYGCIL